MPSERIQRQIERLLDEAERAFEERRWDDLRAACLDVFRLDAANEDAQHLLRAAESALAAATPTATELAPASPKGASTDAHPSSFVAGRYAVHRFLGEGGRKRVYLAHDERLDRDVAFALIKTEGLDEVGRERIVREAQAMGRMGAHPHVVGIYEIGEEAGAPYVVTELLGGGDVEALLAEEPLPLARTLEIAKGVARGLAFAHQQGVVHRDLKPGNVWLTSSGPEGVAKIGDFGLAVALDRSRLTTHGLMVGTVAYMPPEQALGGEVTSQADLYSLGAMLYELVTGKPPFAGDSPTAIISQHINTPPVAPSWHSEHCPPDLEALILRLLAKVPAERPASALEVLAALEAVDPEAPSVRHSDSSANPLDRLARGVFVGRERELERLRSGFDEAFAGRGSVVMLVGEPGIGKTRTVQELSTYARMRGAKVLWGRAHEASGAPPYWPWTQVARAYRDQTSDDIRRRQYEPYAVDLQRILPNLRNLFPNLPEPPPVDSEEAQFQLFDALSSFLRAVSVETPLVVVLDDLHWADRSTLRMLTHLAREVGMSRLLVTGTYRDTDLDRQHPLSQALAELNREGLFTRINLRGLTEIETAAYIRDTAQAEPPSELVRRVHAETEGNPFFLSEVVRLMAEEGAFSAGASSEIRIPEGVKEALGRRLDRLSPEANELLSVAAVVGRECTHPLLAALTDFDDDTLLALIEEALRARVLEETGVPGEYRFTHALMQDALYSELSTARRVRMHGRVAEALETLYAGALDGRAAELARHFGEASVMDPRHARAAARYSRLAAEQASAALAYAEAASHYERCLELVSAAGDRLGEDDAELWTELGVVRALAGEHESGWRAYDKAIDLSRGREPRERVRLLARGLDFAVPRDVRVRRAALLDALTELQGEATVEACVLLARLSMWDFSARGEALAARAAEMAETLNLTGSSRPQGIALRAAWAAMEAGNFSGAIQLTRQLEAEGVLPWPVLRSAYQVSLFAAMCAGEIDLLVDDLRRFAERARQAGDRSFEEAWTAWLAGTLWLRGEGPPLFKVGSAPEVSPRGGSGGRWLLVAAVQAMEMGDPAQALRMVDGAEEYVPGTPALVHGLRTAAWFSLGDEAQARTSMERWAHEYQQLEVVAERMGAVATIGEALCALASEPLLDQVSEFLGGYPSMRYWMVYGGYGGGPDYMKGAIALRLGNLDGADKYFRTGLEWASRPDVRLWLYTARCHQGLSELTDRRGDVERAREHLDAAGTLFAKHGARLYLDQVLAKKQLLGA